MRDLSNAIVEPIREQVHRATDWMRACWRPSPAGMHPDRFQRWAQGQLQYRGRGRRTREARISAAALLAVSATELQRLCATTDEKPALVQGLGDLLTCAAALSCECDVDLDEVMRRRVEHA